ncbi:MAG: hypothetical protein ACJAVI_005301 [Candidatus Azotimanducaceae bacterium]|jgi:hypothetical protein
MLRWYRVIPRSIRIFHCTSKARVEFVNAISKKIDQLIGRHSSDLSEDVFSVSHNSRLQTLASEHLTISGRLMAD